MRLTRRSVSAILALHLAVAWTAVVLRIDRFPLTWAPMYSIYRPRESSEYRVVEKDRRFVARKGWKATHLDGSTSWVSRRAINVPMRSMWRLYYERTWGKQPPRYTQLNHDSGTIDRWLWGLAPGEPFEEVDWRRRLLVCINRSLGHRPGDPDFIVELQAKSNLLVFDGRTFDLVEERPRNKRIHWSAEWDGDFE